MNDLITITEAARILGYAGVKPASAISHLIETGTLRAYPYEGPTKRGMYPGRRLVSRAEVESLLDERRQRLRERAKRAVADLARLDG